MRKGRVSDRKLFIMFVANIIALGCVLIAGCGEKTTTSASDGATTGAGVDQQEAIGTPIPITESSNPDWVIWAEKLCQMCAELPPEAKQQLQTTGEYLFHIDDLPEAHADVIRDCLAQADSLHHGGYSKDIIPPADLSKVTFGFTLNTGTGTLSFRIRTEQAGTNPIIGRWISRQENE